MFKKRCIIGLLFILYMWGQMFPQQVVTREQLLKLFYMAQEAKQQCDVKKEESIYKEIIGLSPRLPQPYLRLGDIYKAETENLKAQKKALLSYDVFMRLKPETGDSIIVSKKMLEVKQQIALLKQSNVKEEKVTVVTSKIEKHIDARPVALPKIKKPETDHIEKIVFPVEHIASTQNLTGRWVSVTKNLDACEAWILDIKQGLNDLQVSLDSRSAIMSTSLFAINQNIAIHGRIDDSKLIIDFTLHGINEEKKEKSLLEAVGTVFEKTLGIDAMEWNLFSDSKKDKRDLLFNYIFELEQTSISLKGTMRTIVTYKENLDEIIVDNVQECELFRAPIDYIGLGFRKLSEKEKKEDPKFREIFNSLRKEPDTNLEALNNLGCLYWSGIGTNNNMDKALKCFATAALGNVDAQLNLALLYLNGYGVKKDVDKARNWFLSAAEKGYKDAYVLCGDTYLFGEKTEHSYDTALFYYNKAIQEGNAFGLFRLGWIYKEGLGVEPDDKMALLFLQKAMTAGYIGAKYEIASIYEKQGNLDKALALLKDAVLENDVQATMKMSEYYLRGQGGVNQDFIQAKTLEKRALMENEEILLGYNSIKPIILNSYRQMIK